MNKINEKNIKIGKALITWRNMKNRCDNETVHKIKPNYKNCILSDKWYDFNNFLQWYNQNYYEVDNEQMCLDKDILYKHNKKYSEETCIFVPQTINKLFVRKENKRGKYPVGVYYNKKSNKYRCQLKSTYLGEYDSPEKAFKIYKIHKERLIKKIAEQYKNKIPNKLYKAMISYEVEITD